MKSKAFDRYAHPAHPVREEEVSGENVVEYARVQCAGGLLSIFAYFNVGCSWLLCP